MEIPVRIRELIIKLRKDGKSLRVIAEIVTKSHSTVQYIINKYQKTNSVENRKHTGRSAKLEHHYKRTILEIIRSEPKIIAPSLANMIDNDYGIKIVPQTIRNMLNTKSLMPAALIYPHTNTLPSCLMIARRFLHSISAFFFLQTFVLPSHSKTLNLHSLLNITEWQNSVALFI